MGHDFEPLTTLSQLMCKDVDLGRQYCSIHSFTWGVEETDFFIPQICSLLVMWDGPYTERLLNHVLKQSSSSVHCAIKLIWYLHSMASYASNESVASRCFEYSRICEMAVVNAVAPVQTPSRHVSPCRRDPKDIEVPFGALDAEGLSVRQQRLGELLEELDRRTISLMAEPPTAESRKERPTMEVPQVADDTALLEEFSRFLEKERRADHLSSHLSFVQQLENISIKLVTKPEDDREDLLRKYLAVLDYSMVSESSLYFPNRKASDPHYRIVRLIAEESRVLSSRDKVPFLVPIEIEYTGKPCSSAVLCQTGSHPRSVVSRPRIGTAGPFGESLEDKRQRLVHDDHHDLMMVIVKAGDDCRQEMLAIQLISQIQYIFQHAGLPLWLYPFHIQVCSPACGIVECVPDAVSIDAIKKKTDGFQSLARFFEQQFGERGTKEHRRAQTNFVESMAAYSLVCYLLQVKDRHNGNILLDAEGHIVHIDFGFFLGNSPGNNWGFEQAPFKLTQEYVEVMGGEDSDSFAAYKLLMIRGFLALRRHADELVSLAGVLLHGPSMDCFYGGQDCITQLRKRFYADKTEQDCIQLVYQLIEESVNNWRSVEYDRYQRITNGIL